jgi:hypothetical protein
MFLDDDPRPRAIAATYCAGCIIWQECDEVGLLGMQRVLVGGEASRRVAEGRNGEDGQTCSLMTPNASALGPMIPAMETKVLTLTVAFVSVISIVLGGLFGYLAFGIYFLTVLGGMQR